MSTQSQPQEEQVTAKMVTDYLRNHPEFFLEQSGLLTDLHIPHPTGSAISLIERQVTVLRDQNKRLKRKLRDLVQVGEDNERLTERVHQLALALMESSTVDEVADILHDRLKKYFNADAVSIRLSALPEEVSTGGLVQVMEADDPLLSAYGDAFKERRPVCGPLNAEQIRHVFGHCEAPVQSAAVVPLAKEGLDGYLGLGSRDSDRFHGSKDTLFLRYLGELASRALQGVRQVGNF